MRGAAMMAVTTLGALPDWLLAAPAVAFVFAVGACVGSFLNVVAYRLPLGMGLFRPGSRCPACETPLTWRENIPILGWMIVGGRCRYCRSRIAPEYALVELATALLFAGLLWAWFPGVGTVGAAWRTSLTSPEWAQAGLWNSWPSLLVVLTLVSCLIGMTLVDAKTFTIPLALPWFATAAAFVIHPLHALTLGWVGRDLNLGTPWVIPAPGGAWNGAAFGGMAGLLLALGLLRAGLVPRSFADAEEWEKNASARAAEGGDPEADADDGAGPTLAAMLVRTVLFTGPAIALMSVGFIVGAGMGLALPGMLVGMVIGLAIGAVLRTHVPATLGAKGRSRVDADAPAAETRAPARWLAALADGAPVVLLAGLGALIGWGEAAAGAGLGLILAVAGRIRAGESARERAEGGHAWLAYPFARREMAKEIVFLLPIVLGAAAGYLLWTRMGWGEPAVWVQALAAVSLGYLVGGAVVWAVRIVGTLAFGAEAMGLGDVHLLAAVGAALGWVDPVLAFAAAPLFALSWAAVQALARGPTGMAMPFGPHLAAAAIAVFLYRPLYGPALEAWWRGGIGALGAGGAGAAGLGP